MRAWEQSGLPISDFCDQEGVSTTTFYKWRRRLKKGRRPRARPRPAAPVEFIEVGSKDQEVGIELLTESGMVVRLRSDFDSAMLRRVLDVLVDR